MQRERPREDDGRQSVAGRRLQRAWKTHEAMVPYSYVLTMIRCLVLALAFGAALPQRAPPAITVARSARAVQPGELVVLTITTVEPAKALHVRAFDKTFLAYASGTAARTWTALVGIDLDVKPGSHAVAISTDSIPPARATHTLVVLSKAFPTRRLTVDESFVNPPPAALERIQRDAKALDQVWSASAANRLWAGGFVRPVPDASNSAFGGRSVFNGQPRSPHGGADFLSPAGRPIGSPGAGRVAIARDLYYTGNTVIIDHGLGLFSMLAHMSAIDVTEGDLVKAGQVVGQVGATGRVTGPHLHWAVRLNGTRVDPLSLLALLGKTDTGSRFP
jgi:murein DD-endopeptidase MepM/ murein hydrolase activator NlpD